MRNTSNSKTYSKGFTLVELLIVIAIIGILGAIAYPSYVEHVRRGKRVEAQGRLQQAAQWMQRFYSTNDQYTGAALPAGLTRSPGNGAADYNIAVATVANPPGYTLTATAAGAMANDRCGNLTLNSQGVKGRSGTAALADCWK